MTKNIKNIGKELLGKSLNSFHRKTGLTQLEKNNEMQDGILNGILSQVDDAYIEKTEQSNVMHLDGSGDGVVILDSIEGNTMVNLWDINKNVAFDVDSFDSSSYGIRIVNDWVEVKTNGTNWITPANRNVSMVKPNTLYTVIFEIKDSTYTSDKVVSVNVNYPYTDSTTGENLNESCIQSATNIPLVNGITTHKFTTREIFNGCKYSLRTQFQPQMTGEGSCKFRVIMLEGDWTNKEIPSYFEGLQSSFEEKVNDEGKYKFEILSNSKNLLNIEKMETGITSIAHPLKISTKNNRVELNNDGEYWIRGFYKVRVEPNTTYTFTSTITKGMVTIYKSSHLKDNFSWNTDYIYVYRNYTNQTNAECTINFTTDSDEKYVYIRFSNEGVSGVSIFNNPMMVKGESKTEYVPYKSNKIKLLINEPLRGIDDVKDRLCVKDGKLVIERNLKERLLDGNSNAWQKGTYEFGAYILKDIPEGSNGDWVSVICNNYPKGKLSEEINQKNQIIIYNHGGTLKGQIRIIDTSCSTLDDFKTKLLNNPTKIVYQCEPYYEEVLNEYGEPIILEGYENGTLYIDSTIVPTTTIRYTPKMESLNTLKEVNNNNVMLTNDINDMIVPYMMEVDLMIMEKEMAIMSHKNIRKIGAEDMTSMQKRTQQMLERLIKGRTLTEQECKTRVTTYLNANKITDEQAEELNFLIDEIYA